jgi:hypothetical protein
MNWFKHYKSAQLSSPLIQAIAQAAIRAHRSPADLEMAVNDVVMRNDTSTLMYNPEMVQYVSSMVFNALRQSGTLIEAELVNRIIDAVFAGAQQKSQQSGNAQQYNNAPVAAPVEQAIPEQSNVQEPGAEVPQLV